VKLRLLAFGAIAALAAVPALLASSRSAEANHSWGGYHWARTINPFTIKLGDNVSSVWDPILATTSTDWSKSTVLDTTIVTGSTTPRQCRATAGRVQVCNTTYGNNGWLGVAQIWISGSHITQGAVKLNDTYHNRAPYNTTAWRNLVSCQEIGHTFGLDHQDENFNNTNLGTCMDYTNNPESNQHPNAHDYEELQIIYDPSKGGHLDTTTTVGAATASAPGRSGSAADEGPNDPADFGQPTGRTDGLGRQDLFVKTLADGRKLFTHVFWELSSNRGKP
jgi:hypothetical protein